jgi:hypothetical protein
MKSILMKLFIICLCVSFFPIQAIAGGKTGAFTIEWIFQRDCDPNQGFEVRLSAAHANPDFCSNDRVLEVSCQDLWYLPSVAVYLTAFSLGAEVDAFVDGCDTEGHALVKAVQMFPPAP